MHSANFHSRRRQWVPTAILVLLSFSFACLPSASPTQCSFPGNLAEPQEVRVEKGDSSWVKAAREDRRKHLQKIGVQSWHKLGLRGKGIKVAILDSGFRGYKKFLGKVLPEKVVVKSFREDGNLEGRRSQHGILCAEVVHSIAPEAELLFANWESNQPESFLAAVQWVKDQGANIITCSLIMPSWSDGEGGGLVNRRLAGIVGTGNRPKDLLFFACAGNTACRHWCGSLTIGKDGYHHWKDSSITNRLNPWDDGRVAVELYGRSVSDYELIVRDAESKKPVGERIVHRYSRQAHPCECVVIRFVPTEDKDYEILLRSRKDSANPEDRFHLVVLGGLLDHYTSEGSIPCPADGPAALAVGAVNDEGRRWDYSSCGPNSKEPKPNFVAIVPFPSLWRPRPFSGTSAAAPQAAGIAALCWSAGPNWSAWQVRKKLKRWACDLGPAGHDCETGYGLIGVPCLKETQVLRRELRWNYHPVGNPHNPGVSNSTEFPAGSRK